MANEKEKRIKRYPNSLEAEKSMLACLLLDRKISMTMLGKLSERDFFDVKNKYVFNAMLALEARGQEIDIVSVSEKLPSVGADPEVVGLDYLVELSDFIPTVQGYEGYYAILKKNTLLRGLLDASNAIAERVYVAEDADACLEYAEQLVLDLAKNTHGTSLVSVGDVVPKVIEDIQNEGINGKARGLMTGFKNFDYHFNGLKPSDVILLAARPGIGKTAFALNIATNIAYEGYKNHEKKNILIFSLEMGASQLVTRMLCNLGRTDNQKINRGELGLEDYTNLRQAAAILCESGIYIDQTANTNPMQIFSKCKQFKLEHNTLDLIIIDYLQLMDTPDNKKSESRQQEVAYISRRIKLLAKELNVPVILLSQLSRAAEQRQEKPQLFDLRDSGSIEQDADIVLFLYKEKNQDPQNEIIELIVGKYRNGRQGSLAFRWDGQYFHFVPQSEDVLQKIVTYGKDGTPQGGGEPISVSSVVNENPIDLQGKIEESKEKAQPNLEPIEAIPADIPFNPDEMTPPPETENAVGGLSVDE